MDNVAAILTVVGIAALAWWRGRGGLDFSITAEPDGAGRDVPEIGDIGWDLNNRVSVQLPAEYACVGCGGSWVRDRESVSNNQNRSEKSFLPPGSADLFPATMEYGSGYDYRGCVGKKDFWAPLGGVDKDQFPDAEFSSNNSTLSGIGKVKSVRGFYADGQRVFVLTLDSRNFASIQAQTMDGSEAYCYVSYDSFLVLDKKGRQLKAGQFTLTYKGQLVPAARNPWMVQPFRSLAEGNLANVTGNRLIRRWRRGSDPWHKDSPERLRNPVQIPFDICGPVYVDAVIRKRMAVI